MEVPAGNRGHWWPPCDFFFSSLSLTLTTTDIIRTPYLMFKNGGGVAYMVNYLSALVTVIFPLVFMEMSLGQFASGGMLSIWNCCPLFKGVGYAAMVTVALVCMYNAAMIGWPLHYLLVTIVTKDAYPWSACDNAWNTAGCYDPTGTTIAMGGILVNTTMIEGYGYRSNPAEEYFTNRFLQASPDVLEFGAVNWELLLALITVWTLSFLSLIFGHYSLGKVAFFTSVGPFAIVLALTVRGCTLPGATDGLKYMFYPETGTAALRMFRYQRVQTTFTSTFYQYLPLFGAFAMLGSYNKKTYNFYRDSILIVVISVLFPIICSVMIGSFAGYLAYHKNISIGNAMSSGPGLAYIMMPEILSSLPQSKIWLSLFFVSMFLLSFGTQIVLLESIVTGIADEFFPAHLGKRSRMIFRTIGAFILCLVLFLPGIGFVTQAGIYWFTIFDWYASSWTIPVLCIFACIACTWIYGINNYACDVETMLGFKPNYLILAGLIVMAPMGGVSLICAQVVNYWPTIQYGEYVFPWWSLVVGWAIAGVSLIMIPLLLIIHCSRSCCCPRAEQRSSGICRRFFEPSPLWKKLKIQTTYQPLAQITAEQLQSGKKPGMYPSVEVDTRL
ncbi:sodium- and chloride-dependent creatine transporter 1-like [Lineus longissimus]|uniref:sodium- and chloride-dependent creatine transporter 1-like n=1 Tax=Lineus longissimus TaxID=88925 RepID=UPI002B4C39D3